MKLARSRTESGIVPVVEVDSRWYDLAPMTAEVDAAVLGIEFPDQIRSAIRGGSIEAIDEPVEFAAPLAGIGRIVCIGLNYRDHAEETGATAPAHRSSS